MSLHSIIPSNELVRMLFGGLYSINNLITNWQTPQVSDEHSKSRTQPFMEIYFIELILQLFGLLTTCRASNYQVLLNLLYWFQVLACASFSDP